VEILIRHGTADDVARIAEVHIASWQAAYRGQLPDEYLQGLSVADRARRWAQFFDEGTVGHILLAERKGVLLGFSNVGPSRDDGADADMGELYAFYLHPNSWGFGVGRVLHAASVELLAEQGFAAATLWVLATNQRARGFYEHSGWKLDDQKKTEWRGDIKLVEVRYRLILPDV